MMTDREIAQMLRESIRTYADFAEQLGDLVLCNEMGSRPLILENGDWDDGDEIFQWYIVSNPTFALQHTDELMFYDDELDLHVLGVTHWGTAWDYVSAPDIR